LFGCFELILADRDWMKCYAAGYKLVNSLPLCDEHTALYSFKTTVSSVHAKQQ